MLSQCLMLRQPAHWDRCQPGAASQATTLVLRECMPAAAIWETTEAVWTLCKSRLEQQPRWVALAEFRVLFCTEHGAQASRNLRGHITVCMTSKPFPIFFVCSAAGRSWS